MGVSKGISPIQVYAESALSILVQKVTFHL